MSRTTILQTQGHSCHYCQYQWPGDRASITRLIKRGGPRAPTMDHRVPRARGGTDHPDNLVVCCQQCNSEKAHLTETEYMAARHDRRVLLAERLRTIHLTRGDQS